MWIGHGRRERLLARAFVLGAGVLIATTLAPRSGAAADQEKVLYSFCAQGGFHCTDGAKPVAGLIMDAAGNLYGTTEGKSPEDTSGPRVRLASAKVERAGALPP